MTPTPYIARSGVLSAAEKEAAWQWWLARALRRPQLPPEQLTWLQQLRRLSCGIGDASINMRSNG